MAEIILTTLLTLDGVMEAPGGEPGHPHTGWAGRCMGPEEIAFKQAEAEAAGALLLGRVTYASFLEGWRQAEGAFAARMNAMPKYVVTRDAAPLQWQGARRVEGPLLPAIAALKEAAEGPLLLSGSRRLAQALLAGGLVDELRLMIFPVTVGGGRRLFATDDRLDDWKLEENRAFETGTLALRYRRKA
ncbi:dihydrofolate reductase family protein [Roseomonas sp. 18066]|uniref:dihydrofolate reductase family protein n=1 Tax=Roseomonas sp. 18066 TaxID=2681412 RepID=UPI00135A57B8|nr:dihydrofolate reductase family protein [Roseomonas sp. 18066]